MYRINHIHIKVTDLHKSINWYVKAFSFKVINDFSKEKGYVACASEDGGVGIFFSRAAVLEKYRLDEAGSLPLDHFAVESENLEYDLERLEKLGATRIQDPVRVSETLRVAQCKTPDQVRVELYEQK